MQTLWERTSRRSHWPNCGTPTDNSPYRKPERNAGTNKGRACTVTGFVLSLIAIASTFVLVTMGMICRGFWGKACSWFLHLRGWFSASSACLKRRKMVTASRAALPLPALFWHPFRSSISSSSMRSSPLPSDKEGLRTGIAPKEETHRGSPAQSRARVHLHAGAALSLPPFFLRGLDAQVRACYN